jgi:hypothetical protein
MYAGSTHVNFTQGQAFIEHHVWKLSETLSSSTAAQQVVGAAVHVVGNRSAGGRLVLSQASMRVDVTGRHARRSLTS